MLVAAVAVRSTPTVTPPAGFVPVRSTPNGTTTTVHTYVKVAGGSEPSSYSFGFSPSSTASVIVSTYSGVSTVVPLDGDNGQPNPSSKSVTAPGVTTGAANDMLVGVFATALSFGCRGRSGPPVETRGGSIRSEGVAELPS